MTEPTRFRISWDKGAYYVSIPNYQGGEVVPASISDDLVKALEMARDAVEYSIEVHGTDHGGMMLSTLNQIDRVLGRVKSPGGPDA
jgi:hypothetical protein